MNDTVSVSVFVEQTFFTVPTAGRSQEHTEFFATMGAVWVISSFCPAMFTKIAGVVDIILGNKLILVLALPLRCSLLRVRCCGTLNVKH